MKFCSIASGSSGNCIYVGSGKTSLLIDAGISGKRIEAGLNSFDQTGKDIDGILVTHEHADHIKSIGVLQRKLSVPIYGTKKTLRAIEGMSSMGKLDHDLFRPIEANAAFSIGDLEISPFSVSHDAADPVGYRVSDGKYKAAVATDMGVYDSYIINNLQNLDILLLESNHDVRMLECGVYPYYLKQRILGNRGHLSNEMAGQLLSDLLHDNMKKVFLGHLSHENNYPALAFETVCAEVTMGPAPYKAKDFDISIARRDEVGELVEL